MLCSGVLCYAVLCNAMMCFALQYCTLPIARLCHAISAVQDFKVELCFQPDAQAGLMTFAPSGTKIQRAADQATKQHELLQLEALMTCCRGYGSIQASLPRDVYSPSLSFSSTVPRSMGF